MELQKITADLSQLHRQWGPDIVASRVETGPLQINDDWPSLHIRGDNAGWLAMQLDQGIELLKKYSDKTSINESIIIGSMESLSNLLKSSIVRHDSARPIDNIQIDNDFGC